MFDYHGQVQDCEKVAKPIPDRELAFFLYTCMVKTRIVEDVLLDSFLRKESRIAHFCNGQEAIGVGAVAAMRPDDFLFHSHRGHSQYITRGADLNKFFAEFFSKETATTRARGGVFHLVDFETNIMGGQGILGDAFPIATGSALTTKMNGGREVTVVFFGDGNADEGTFYECMNFATLHELPILFICENNFYSITSAVTKRNPVDIRKKADLFMPSFLINGTVVEDVYFKMRQVLDCVRDGRGPAFIEMRAYRFCGHTGADNTDDVFRTHAERNEWLAHDPITKYEVVLRERGYLDDDSKERVYADVWEEVQAAMDFARNSPYPDPEELPKDVYCEENTIFSEQGIAVQQLFSPRTSVQYFGTENLSDVAA